MVSMRVLVGVVVLALIIGGFALGLAGWDVSAIAGLLAVLVGVITPLLALIRQNEKQNETLDQQNQALDQITEQTNGNLDKRIAAAVRKGIDDYTKRSVPER